MIYIPREEGQGLVEYALILLFIAIALIVIVTLFGTELSSTYSSITSGVEDAMTH
ncbi:MAG: Flp family type IVb pilin [Anaerolineae bacterium]|jgi:pilus assembly protein Flp/PilA|nr:Flp family type IVb pilin [Anaerolineae bacterium]